MGNKKGELLENLFKLSQEDALDVSHLEEQTQSLKLDDDVPELEFTLKEWLMRGRSNSKFRLAMIAYCSRKDDCAGPSCSGKVC